MDVQPDSFGKLALCFSSCMLAKEAVVAQNGIGEDLPFTLFGWSDDHLIVVAQLHPGFMREPHETRLALVAFCCAVFRGAWRVDSITFVAEAFCSSSPSETVGKDLHQLFADSNQAVSECLTFTHVDDDGVALILLPYRQELGRKVAWDEAAFQRRADGLRDSLYPKVILEMLGGAEMRVDDGDRVAFLETVASGLAERGFNVQYGF